MMTVGEMIDELNKFPNDRIVSVTTLNKLHKEPKRVYQISKCADCEEKGCDSPIIVIGK
jgi:ribosomal protein L34E